MELPPVAGSIAPALKTLAVPLSIIEDDETRQLASPPTSSLSSKSRGRVSIIYTFIRYLM